MSDPLEFLAGYVSPLTDVEHATIGRIALLWGQADHFVEQLLPVVSELSWEQLKALQIPDKPLGSKVVFLKASAKKLSEASLREQVLTFCALIDDCKAHRNHVFHGMWGWRGDQRTGRVIPAARKESELHNPFPSSKLPALERKLCRASRAGFDLVTTLVFRQNVRPHPSRFLHHGAPGGAPEWFEQWTSQNPWDGDTQDRIEIAGQLPRRARLYPEK